MVRCARASPPAHAACAIACRRGIKPPHGCPPCWSACRPMGKSLSAWLSLREAADARARSMELTRRIADVLPPDTPLRLVDLASGTGSNIRYLASRLPGPQRWLAVDRDAALLDEVPRIVQTSFACQVETRRME